MSQSERRLAAIMFTDIVGYTATSQKNEKLALEKLDEHRSLLRSHFQANDGREINAMGDAFLVEFSSSLKAVQCGIGIQRVLNERNKRVPPDNRIYVRVGIHVGDVMVRNHDVYGDAVNIASRIEQLAPPGGISVSQNVADDVRNKISFSVERQGTFELRNVALPMEVYRVKIPWEAAPNEIVKSSSRHRIAVLPFSNLSSTKEDEYFVEGMMDELISTLSNFANLGVIARTSVMRYKRTSKGVSEIARELNVEAVLEGSVRKLGNELRVTVQLADGKTEEYLWAKTFDREITNIFAIQSEIAHSVAEAMEVEMEAMERQRIEDRATWSVEAHSLYLRGRYEWEKRTEESLKTAMRCFEDAVSKAPDYALAYVGMADYYRIMSSRGFMRPEDALPKAKRLAIKALELDETLAEAHAAMAHSLENDWDWDAAEREFKRAIELNPSYSLAYHWYALYLGHMGRPLEGIIMARKAEALDPLTPMRYSVVFEEYYLAAEYDNAISECTRAMQLDPDFPIAHLDLGRVYAKLQMLEKAKPELEKAASESSETEIKAVLAYAYALSGETEKARRIYDDLLGHSKNRYVSKPCLALIRLGLGEKEEALALLVEACDQRAEALEHWIVDPFFDELRSDERFVDVLKRVKLGIRV